MLLSTVDWALIETWQEAGIPLDAALRGIDAAFDKYEARQKKGRMRKINGLAWCAQAVMEAAEELREAAAGTAVAKAEGAEGRCGGRKWRVKSPGIWRMEIPAFPPSRQRKVARTGHGMFLAVRGLRCPIWRRWSGH